jgi:hypothetical protein
MKPPLLRTFTSLLGIFAELFECRVLYRHHPPPLPRTASPRTHLCAAVQLQTPTSAGEAVQRLAQRAAEYPGASSGTFRILQAIGTASSVLGGDKRAKRVWRFLGL